MEFPRFPVTRTTDVLPLRLSIKVSSTNMFAGGESVFPSGGTKRTNDRRAGAKRRRRRRRTIATVISRRESWRGKRTRIGGTNGSMFSTFDGPSIELPLYRQAAQYAGGTY